MGNATASLFGYTVNVQIANETEEDLTITDVDFDSSDFYKPLPRDVFLGKKIEPNKELKTAVINYCFNTCCPVQLKLTYDDLMIDRFDIVTKGITDYMQTEKFNFTAEADTLMAFDEDGECKSHRKDLYKMAEDYIGDGKTAYPVFLIHEVDHKLEIRVTKELEPEGETQDLFWVYITVKYTDEQKKYRTQMQNISKALAKITIGEFAKAEELLSELTNSNFQVIEKMSKTGLSDVYEGRANETFRKIDELLKNPKSDYKEIEKLYASAISDYNQALYYNSKKFKFVTHKIAEVRHLQQSNKRHNEIMQESTKVMGKLENYKESNNPEDRQEAIEQVADLIDKFSKVKKSYKEGGTNDLNVDLATKLIHKQIVELKKIETKMRRDQLQHNMGQLDIVGMAEMESSLGKGHIEYVRQINYK